MVKSEEFDIVFLHQTHCCIKKEARFWETQYNVQAFWTFWLKHSCGVSILPSSPLKCDKSSFNFDFKERYVINIAEYR